MASMRDLNLQVDPRYLTKPSPGWGSAWESQKAREQSIFPPYNSRGNSGVEESNIGPLPIPMPNDYGMPKDTRTLEEIYQDLNNLRLRELDSEQIRREIHGVPLSYNRVPPMGNFNKWLMLKRMMG